MVTPVDQPQTITGGRLATQSRLTLSDGTVRKGQFGWEDEESAEEYGHWRGGCPCLHDPPNLTCCGLPV